MVGFQRMKGGDDNDHGNRLSIHERVDPSRSICTTKRGERSWRKIKGVITGHRESSFTSSHVVGGSASGSGSGSGNSPNFVRLIPFTASSSSKFDGDMGSRTLSMEERKRPSFAICSTRPSGIIGRKRSGNNSWRVLEDQHIGSTNNRKAADAQSSSTDLRDSDKIPLVFDTTELSDSRNEEESTLGGSAVYEKEGEEETEIIVTRSYNYYLLSGNRQISYFEDPGKNPYKCMSVIDYDFFPVYVGSDRCLIKVESSSVSYFDCIIRQGSWRGDIQPHPLVPGFDAVGEVLAAGPEAKFNVGDKVATVVRRGGNSRYAVASHLVKIDSDENVHDVCGILSTYVAAFQVLHTGDEDSTNSATSRYFHECLKGQVIFVNGAMSGFGQAVIHLARLFGAETLYATSKPKDFDHLRELGSIPLLLGSTDVMGDLSNSIDLVIDMTTFAGDSDMFEYLSAMRKETTGRLVFSAHGDIAKNGKHGVRSSYDLLQLRSKILLLSNVYLCDHLDPNTRLRYFKNDFTYLRNLMRLRGKDKLHVKVVATLSLDEVPHAHYKLGNSNVRGVITCDPWL